MAEPKNGREEFFKLIATSLFSVLVSGAVMYFAVIQDKVPREEYERDRKERIEDHKEMNRKLELLQQQVAAGLASQDGFNKRLDQIIAAPRFKGNGQGEE